MGHFAFLFVNTALIFGCATMAIVFLTLPLPPNNDIRKYRISLRFLAGAYLSMAAFKVIEMVFDVPAINFMSIPIVTIASLQALLFTFALITLINPPLITRRLLYLQLIPIPVLIILFLIASANWGNPKLVSFTELKEFVLHPTIIIRELFFLYYGLQLFNLTSIFTRQTRVFEKEIDNYFADNDKFQLPWVKYCFYAALTVGICAILSCFVFSKQIEFIFSLIYAIFYLVFGIFYIQYPSTFVYILPAIYPLPLEKENVAKSDRRTTWIGMKNQILDEKYYLRTGVNIEDMARYLKIGRTTLSGYINNEEKMTFNQWINSLRIQEAQNLLTQNKTLTLVQIAEQVGYSECSNFSKQFKLVTNETPSVWRQIKKEQTLDSNHSC
jgi:AraC-like DNA-binding protein